MKLLALETSTQICAAAIVDGEKLLAEYRTNLKNVHAAMIFKQVYHLMSDVGMELSDFAGIAVSIGPGSFTGLRIGLSAAKGLALANQLSLIGVPSLESVIAGVPIESGRFAVIRKARADEYYFSVYTRRNWQDKSAQEVEVISSQSVIDRLPTPCFLAGDVGELPAILPSDCTVLPESVTLPSAFQVARIGRRLLKSRVIIDLDSAEPHYHQEFVAAKPTAAV